MVLLYYRIFKAIRERGKKKIGSAKSSSIATTVASGAPVTRRKTDDASSQDLSHALVIENVAQTRRQEDSNVVDNVRHPLPLITEAATVYSKDLNVEEDDDEDDSEAEDDAMECKVIRNPATVTPLHGNHSNTRSQSTLEGDDGRTRGHRSSVEYPVKIERGTKGDPDSGYVLSSQNLEETQFSLSITASIPVSKPAVNSVVKGNTRRTGCEEGDDVNDVKDESNLTTGNGKQEKSPNSSKHESSLHQPKTVQEAHRPSSSSDKTVKSRGDSSGSKDDEEDESEEGDDRVPPSTSTSPAPQAMASSVSATITDDKKKKKLRFHLRRKPKETTKTREKASAKRERKATKTLAIVLGKAS